MDHDVEDLVRRSLAFAEAVRQEKVKAAITS